MRTFFIKLIILVVYLSLVILTAGIMTCAAKTDSIKKPSKADYIDESSKNNEDIDLLNDKNNRFRIVVLAIKQNIIEKYKKLDDLESEEDYLQFIEYCEVSD